MAAAKPSKNEECEEDETDINMAARARSVLVKGLPPGTTSNDVTIYFQKTKNGGGEVEGVKLFSEKEGTAIVIFEEREVAESVLSKQHKIKEVKIRVEPLIKVFAKVTANVDSEALGVNDEEIGHLLEKIKKETNIEVHFASYGYLITGTFEQIATLRQDLQKVRRPRKKSSVENKYVLEQSTTPLKEKEKEDSGNMKPQHSQEESSTFVEPFQESTDEEEDEGYQTTDNFMKMFEKVYKEQLDMMKKNYKVKILQCSDSKGEMKVKVEPKDGCRSPQLREAREKFITLYQTAHQNTRLVRFITRDKSEAKDTKLRRIIQKMNKELPVVIYRAEDRVSYQIYGTTDAVEQALRELQDTVGIKTDEFQVNGAGSYTGQSSSLFDEAMDVDEDDELHMYEHQCGAVKICVLKGDITDQRVDAIVNAANENLDHGGGVARAIVDKGGYGIQEESYRIVHRYGKVEVGDVVVTKSGHLPCKKIIHAVGPRWYAEGEERSRELLKEACINSLITAENLKLTSIAFPAISSGIFGMPKETSAEVMFASVEEYAGLRRASKPVVTEVRFVNIDKPTVKVFRQEFEFLYGGIDDNTPEQDEARDKNSKRERIVNQAERHSREIYNPSRYRTGQLNPGEKSEEDTAVEKTGGGVSGKRGKRPLRTNKAQTKAFTQERVHQHPLSGDGRSYNSSPSYSAAVKGSSSLSIKDQDNKWKTQKEDKHLDVAEKPNDAKCPVCLDQLDVPKTLPKCGHVFCTTCIDEAFKRSKTCPVCKEVYGITRGNQPPGQMNWYSSYYRVPGYEKYGSIQIVYYFPSGRQGLDHPSPGKWYSRTSREAFLPDCSEGREVLHLLKKAFDAGLVFTIGRSATTGQDNQIVWNDIHHKTSYTGGPTHYGYPDPTYLSRVKEELAAKGIR